MKTVNTQVLVAGGGLGGVAAALAAARHGLDVVLTEEFAWLGGQLTSQAVPSDEHAWIEDFGCSASYRRLRDGVRDYYRRAYPLTKQARGWPDLNPGAGWVSRLCSEPRVAVAVIDEMLAPHRSNGRLTVLQPFKPTSADSREGRVHNVTFRNVETGQMVCVEAQYVIDATEVGDLLPLADVEYRIGFESREETGEPSAPEEPQPDNLQAISVCFAFDHVEGEDHTIERPQQYDHWSSVAPEFWGGNLVSWTAPHPRTLEITQRHFEPNPGDDPLEVDADQSRNPGDGNLWTFRRILAKDLFEPGTFTSDICLANWPSIDYFEGPVVDVDSETEAQRLRDAKELSKSMMYWMQTEAPRPDGGYGWPGLRLRPDVMGTDDGFAMAPYHREGRRILALETIREQDVTKQDGREGARVYKDSVGIGMYRIDLHPSTGGDNYIDVPAEPFEIPLGALIPRAATNLIAGAKNIGTTHITNGCYRLHPVEWNIGEAAGVLAWLSITAGVTPREIHAQPDLVAQLQEVLLADGVELHWPEGVYGY